MAPAAPQTNNQRWNAAEAENRAKDDAMFAASRKRITYADEIDTLDVFASDMDRDPYFCGVYGEGKRW